MRQVAAQSAGPAEPEGVVATESNTVAEAENAIVFDDSAQSIIAVGYHQPLPDPGRSYVRDLFFYFDSRFRHQLADLCELLLFPALTG